MGKEINIKEMIGSIEGISKLAKSISHPKRLQLLILLEEEDRNFSTLINRTNLKKTALSNHLTLLITNHLVQKSGRGNYQITTDGLELLKATTRVYEKSKSREKFNREKLRKQYSNVRMKMIEKSENLLSQDPKMEGAWISYIGAVLGVLKSLSIKRRNDRISIGGYTGYAFALPNVMKGGTCPSGPTALAVWEEIVNATNNLGYKVHQYYDIGGIFASDEMPDKDKERAMKLFRLIKSSIDNDKPVVLWGLVVIEYGIVKGYTGDSYIVSSLVSPIDTQVRYDKLLSPGALHAIFFDEEGSDLTEEIDKEVIERAIKFAEGSMTHDNYVAGPSAYDEWANNLESKSEEDHPYHGNSYNGECVLEAKTLSKTFVERLSERYHGKPQAKLLGELSQVYSKIAEQLGKFQKIFPFALEGEMPRDKCLEGAKILRATKPLEIQALKLLKETYKAWV
ncbi:MAG: hypothetical protein ACW96S_09030 [Promethearchaeota archaeon]|jgi:DNA-binding transcriptional ArsR family regulator